MSEQKHRFGWGAAAALIAALVAIFALSFSLAPDAAEGEESFPGTDAVATEVLEERGIEPWFDLLFEPGSGEIESGLFALQAALGAGLLGFALGSLHGRSRVRSQQGASTESTQPAPTEHTPSD